MTNIKTPLLSIYNTYAYLKKTGDALQTSYLLFFNRYAIGYYHLKNPTQKVRKLLVFSPICMTILSPAFIIKIKIKIKNRNIKNIDCDQ